LEVVHLWNTFQIDFPEDTINKLQMTEIVKRIFPRCNAEVVISNLFKVFDPDNSGSVVPTELLVAFSMSMKGSVTDKLRWTFKLYDRDGSGEIDPEEMEDIFKKLCKIAAGIEADQNKIKAKELKVERLKAEKEREKQENEKAQSAENIIRGINEPSIYSRKKSRSLSSTKTKEEKSRRLDTEDRRKSCGDAVRGQGEVLETIPEMDDTERKTVMEMIIAELKESEI